MLRDHLAPAALILTAGTIAVPVVAATPAYAATVVVTDLSGLQTALGPGCTNGDVVELDADVVAPTAALTASCAVTLDLRGATTLRVRNVVVSPAAALTVTGAATDVLTVDAGADEKLAGIADTGATLVLRDLRVEASGGRLGAGIGGAYTEAAGTTVIGGTAQVTVEADANSQGAAIGGGYLADGGATTIQDDAQVTLTTRTSSGGAALGGGYAGDGGQITVRDRARVEATARSGANGAAIGGGFQGDGGTIVIQDSADVLATARSGAKGAAIGGGYQGDGGSVTVSGGARVVATSSVSGNIVGASIGGGPGGDGADVVINGGHVTAGASDEGAPLGPGSPVAGEPRRFGSLLLAAGTLRLPSGVLHVSDTPGVTEIVIGAGGHVVGSRRPRSASASAAPAGATITGAGQIVNDGAIALPEDAVRASHLTRHHYLVVFRTPGAPRVQTRVFAKSFRAGKRHFVPAPTRPGFRFVEWNTRPDGRGARIGASSTLPGYSTGRPHVVRLYAVWRRR